jgi:hypothetical protein
MILKFALLGVRNALRVNLIALFALEIILHFQSALVLKENMTMKPSIVKVITHLNE